MPKYPLSSKLLALFSGSFYGTAGPGQERKTRRKARRRAVARRDEKDERGSSRRDVERRDGRRTGRGKGGGEGGVPKRRSEGQDKPLCPHGGPRGPNAGPWQRISSSRSHISRIPLSYFILLAPSPAPGTTVPPGTAAGPFEGPESTSFFVISLFESPDSLRLGRRDLCAAAPSTLRARVDRFLITVSRERPFSSSP